MSIFVLITEIGFNNQLGGGYKKLALLSLI